MRASVGPYLLRYTTSECPQRDNRFLPTVRDQARLCGARATSKSSNPIMKSAPAAATQSGSTAALAAGSNPGIRRATFLKMLRFNSIKNAPRH